MNLVLCRFLVSRATPLAAALAWPLACATVESPEYGADATTNSSTNSTGGNGSGGSTGGSDGGMTLTTGTPTSSTSNSNTGGAPSTTATSASTSSAVTTSSSTTLTSTTSGTLSSTTVTTTGTSTVTDTTGSGGTGGADACPDDPDKTEPGACDCGTPDTDTDGDETPDCNDQCPDDPEKTAPGGCGCGEVEDAECAALVSALVHRYSFDGSGNMAGDSVGDADATLSGASQSGGAVALTGAGYVDLPNGIASSLTSASFEVWLTWSGGDAWQRIFDFGSSDMGEDSAGVGETYLFLTPMALDDTGTLRVAFTDDGPDNEVLVDGSAALPTGSQVHVAVTIGGGTMALYLNGALQDSVAFSGSLSSLDDVNNWLGSSQFSADPHFEGSIAEFRVYDAALTAGQVQKSYELGPDAALAE